MNSPVAVHASAETDPGAAGRELGAAHGEAIRRTCATYARLFAAHGLHPHHVRDHARAALSEIGSWAPHLAEEIEGIAHGCGLPVWRVGAVNARTEILAAADVTGEGECSTSVVLPGDGEPPRTVQTWDWHDILGGAMLVRTLVSPSGRAIATFTEHGVVGKIGVNDLGLGVHFNVLRHRSDGGRAGVPVHVVARRVLEEAATVDEALRIAATARLSASTVLTVVTRDEARCLELSPAGIGEVAPREGFLTHTNHFLAPELADGERTSAAESSTFERHAWLAGKAPALSAADPTARARALCAHRDDAAPVCAHADLALPEHRRWETLATISLDVTARTMHVHPGGPCAVGEESWLTVPAARPR
ncbi:isopenicillin-N N-acyltransferase like protein [Prauserella marina]|uniref:Isopenicillin-N N-acyltransferase like protein n=1 Tax=Prauserella marina TaxID=530584 RepID=A0A1G6JL29_9PSEU|nr:C45 family peptidase [Prauserella marina]PWV84551.1 isopenicillin-N N-acyltransferase-like protein [Prauserella marina]SDC19423.1 isopenicillin-N N-acyltransferase like protein [Prauserella marina]